MNNSAEADTKSDESPIATKSESKHRLGYGIFLGIFLCYTVFWLIVVFGLFQLVSSADPLLLWMHRFALILTVLAPAIWAYYAFKANSTDTPARRMLFLLAGALLLFPWPALFVITNLGAA